MACVLACVLGSQCRVCFEKLGAHEARLWLRKLKSRARLQSRRAYPVRSRNRQSDTRLSLLKWSQKWAQFTAGNAAASGLAVQCLVATALIAITIWSAFGPPPPERSTAMVCSRSAL